MEILLAIAVVVIGVGIGAVIGKVLGTLSRGAYRAKWEAAGRVDAQMDFSRFVSSTQWIQKFYDTGYDSVAKEKANV